MNKKVIIIISAVLAFFAGAILVSEVPVVATLVAFLEVCAGFVCGFFFAKTLANEELTKYQTEIKSLREAQKAMNEEKKVRVNVKRTSKANKE